MWFWSTADVRFVVSSGLQGFLSLFLFCAGKVTSFPLIPFSWG